MTNRKYVAAAATAGLLALATACGTEPAKADAPASVSPAADTTTTTDSPYRFLPKAATFQVTSETIKDRQPLPQDQQSAIFKAPGGKDVSPQLSWSGFPAQTKSFVVSLYDPEAPTGSGFWHWVVADIPATTTSLPLDAGALGSKSLPSGAFQLGADAGMARYIGGAPPAGGGVHNYYFTVSALDVEKTGLDTTASGAYLGFTIAGHTIGRATIVAPTSA